MAEAGIGAFVSRGQRFTFASHEPYRTKDGRDILLVVLETICPDCQHAVSVRTSEPVDIKRLSRRCLGCRKPGVKAQVLPRKEPTR